MTPLQASLTATEVRDGMAWVEYDLRLDDRTVASVRERGESLSRGGWSGFRRIFEVRMMGGERANLHLWLPAYSQKRILFVGKVGESFLLEDSSAAATIYHRRLLLSTSDPERSTLTVELLFGLPASSANLEALRKSLP